MAQQVMVRITDDIDGGEADYTVPFGIDGKTFEVDLSEENASKLMALLQPFVKAARMVKKDRNLKPVPVVKAVPEKRLVTPADLVFEDPDPASPDDTVGQDDDVTYPPEEAKPTKASKIRALAEKLGAPSVEFTAPAPARTKVAPKVQTSVMREWALLQPELAEKVGKNGRLKPEVVAAFNAAHDH